MILITGATGNVGRELVQQLSNKGESLRVVTRDENKISFLDPRIERVVGDISEDAIAERAVDGVSRIFMFPVIFDQSHHSSRVLLEKAKRNRVRHVVMLSSLGVPGIDTKLHTLHLEKEKLVEQSGIAWTFLRPGAFMSNSLQWLSTIQSQGKVFSPTGEGRTAPISPRDIAAVAAVTLTSPGHEGRIYELTGSELLNTREQVEILSNSIRKHIECVNVPISAVTDEMRKSGAPEFLLDSVSKMWEHIKNGEGSTQTQEVERLTGRPAETFWAWCNAHKAIFSSTAL